MPVEVVIDHPLAQTMSNHVFGTLMRIVLHYWNTDCRPLPTDDRELMLIGRAGRRVWTERRGDVMAVLTDVLPAFDRYHQWRENVRQHWADNREKGQAVKTLKKVREARKGAEIETDAYMRAKKAPDPTGLPIAPLPGLTGRAVRTG